jgi:hypothetical protein
MLLADEAELSGHAYTLPAPVRLCEGDHADGFHAWLDDYARKAAAGADVSRRLAKPGRDDP